MSLVATVQGFLEQGAIPFLPHGPNTFLLGFPDPEGIFHGDLQVDETNRILLVQLAPPLKATRDKLTQMTELVARANPHIVQGNLQIGLPGGLITCKTSLSLGNSDCQPDLFYNLLVSNWREIKRWLPAMKAVIINGLSPEQATDLVLSSDQHAAAEDTAYNVSGFLRDIRRGSMN